MSAAYGSFFVLLLTMTLAPAFAANAPPHAAPLTPVTVAPLPPVREQTAVATPAPPPPASAAAPVIAERPWWQRPELYAGIALLETFGASAATIAYLRKPDRGRLRIALALTATSGVFVAAALAAWLL